MLEMLTLVGHLALPAELEWSKRKQLLRERLVQVLDATDTYHRPRLTMARLHGRHGVYDHARERIVLDLESVHDARKFWHVYHETIPHELAHAVNRRTNGARGHGAEFRELLDSFRG